MTRRTIPLLLAAAAIAAPMAVPQAANAAASTCTVDAISADLSYTVCILPGNQVNSSLRDVKGEYQGNPENIVLTLYINGSAVTSRTSPKTYAYWVVDMGNHYNGDKAKVCSQSLPFAGRVCSPTVTL